MLCTFIATLIVVGVGVWCGMTPDPAVFAIRILLFLAALISFFGGYGLANVTGFKTYYAVTVRDEATLCWDGD